MLQVQVQPEITILEIKVAASFEGVFNYFADLNVEDERDNECGCHFCICSGAMTLLFRLRWSNDILHPQLCRDSRCCLFPRPLLRYFYSSAALNLYPDNPLLLLSERTAMDFGAHRRALTHI